MSEHDAPDWTFTADEVADMVVAIGEMTSLRDVQNCRAYCREVFEPEEWAVIAKALEERAAALATPPEVRA